MKIALLILAIGLSVVASMPNESNRGVIQLPCGGVLEQIVSCTCDGGDVVTPGGQSCNDLGQGVASCECKDGLSARMGKRV